MRNKDKMVKIDIAIFNDNKTQMKYIKMRQNNIFMALWALTFFI